MGRPYFMNAEFRQMLYAENFVIAYQSRAKSQNWTEWVQSNPRAAEMLFEIEKIL